MYQSDYSQNCHMKFAKKTVSDIKHNRFRHKKAMLDWLVKKVGLDDYEVMDDIVDEINKYQHSFNMLYNAYLSTKEEDVFFWIRKLEDAVGVTLLPKDHKVAPKSTKITSGIKHDTDKPSMALIPTRAEVEEAKVWSFGANKYEANNWRKGFYWTRILSAMHRHYTKYKNGETLDEETGISHMAHIRCCAAMLLEFETTHPELDDRWKENDKKR